METKNIFLINFFYSNYVLLGGEGGGHTQKVGSYAIVRVIDQIK